VNPDPLPSWRELSGVHKPFRDLSAEEWYGLCRYEDDRNYLEFGQFRTMPLRFVGGIGISPLLVPVAGPHRIP
jgi:hypothetical protein